jgi:predicted O-methyltransferase YrrM
MKSLERLFFRRPRILNQLHRLRLVSATSQTNEEELAALERHAAGAERAVEIGTYQGVSASHIAAALHPEGRLYCVDPWPKIDGRPDPCWLICQRHLHRRRLLDRVTVLRGTSREMQAEIPQELDFAFIDGDHSWAGLETDWNIVAPRMRYGATICLHDAVIPASEPWRVFGSVDFFNQVVAKDSEFEWIATTYSMAIVRRRSASALE